MKFLKVFENFKGDSTIFDTIKEIQKKSEEDFVTYLLNDLKKYNLECHEIIQSPDRNFEYFLTIGVVPLLVDKQGIRYDSFNKKFDFPKKFNILKIFKNAKELSEDIKLSKIEIYFEPNIKNLTRTGIFND